MNDGSYGQQLYQHFLSLTKDAQELQRYFQMFGERNYLIGSVASESKKATTSKKFYEIQWEHSRLGETPVDLDVILGAHELYLKITKKPAVRRKSSLFEKKVRESLAIVDDINYGVRPYESEGESDIDDDEEAYTIRRRKNEVFAPIGNAYPPNKTNLLEDGYHWSAMGTVDPPFGLSHSKRSHVREDCTGYFQTPISSFLAFVPVKLFEAFASYSTAYAQEKMAAQQDERISGRRWLGDISVQEMMVFFGILIKMVLRPTPGQPYAACWDDQAWHPYTRAMPLTRFQQIRSVLHFNDNSKMPGSQDAAFKVSCVCFG
jgi:hypothetical protein